MDKRRFQIGDWVATTATITTDYEGTKPRKKVVIKKPTTIIGQIAGLKRLYLGEYHASGIGGYSFGSEPDEIDQAYLAVEETVTAWEIKRGMFNKAVYVLDEDIYPTIISLKQKLPLLHTVQSPWSEEDRQAMREEMAGVKRDSKGRWT